jgi:3-deoxy-D-manno-octulosonic-acid transferase
VDFRDVLPFDGTSDARAALTALAPTALVFSKLDVWPTLAREASARGVRLGLISATLARGRCWSTLRRRSSHLPDVQ